MKRTGLLLMIGVVAGLAVLSVGAVAPVPAPQSSEIKQLKKEVEALRHPGRASQGGSDCPRSQGGPTNARVHHPRPRISPRATAALEAVRVQRHDILHRTDQQRIKARR